MRAEPVKEWDQHWHAVEATLRSVSERIRPHVSSGWRIDGPGRARGRQDLLGGHLDLRRRDGSYQYWAFQLKVWVHEHRPDHLDLRAQLERTNGDEFWNLRHITRGQVDVDAALSDFLGVVEEDWTFWVDLIDDLPPIG